MYVEGINSLIFPSGLLKSVCFPSIVVLPGLKVATEAPGIAVPKQEWGAGTKELSPHDLHFIREEIFSKEPPVDFPCDW